MLRWKKIAAFGNATRRFRIVLFAVSTNLLYDFGGAIYPMAWTPNLSVEVPIGPHWSVYAEYDFPWWLSRHKASDPMDVLHGHFLGIGLGAGYYDIEPQHSGYPVMSADSNHPGRAGTWEIKNVLIKEIDNHPGEIMRFVGEKDM